MSNPAEQIIWLHKEAPTKPVVGASCNGCGVCCAAQPCPVAALVLWQVSGACRALEWQDGLYRCGVLAQPRRYVRWLPAVLEGVFQRWVRRSISADVACDSDVPPPHSVSPH